MFFPGLSRALLILKLLCSQKDLNEFFKRCICVSSAACAAYILMGLFTSRIFKDPRYITKILKYFLFQFVENAISRFKVTQFEYMLAMVLDC